MRLCIGTTDGGKYCKILKGRIQDLLVVRDVIASYRYLSQSGSTGRYGGEDVASFTSVECY